MEDQNPMEDLKEELKEMIDGVGEAAPLVAVAQKDEVQMLSLLDGDDPNSLLRQIQRQVFQERAVGRYQCQVDSCCKNLRKP